MIQGHPGFITASRTLDPDHAKRTAGIRLTPEAPGGTVTVQGLFDSALRHLRRALLEAGDGGRDAALKIAFARWQVEEVCRAAIEERRGRDAGAWEIASIRITAAFEPVEKSVEKSGLTPDDRLDVFHAIQRDLCWLRDTLPSD